MKIHQLLSGVQIAITNEEQDFVNRHDDNIKLTSLDSHDQWLAQNLVRRGAYAVSNNDDNILIRNINETNTR